MPETLQLSPNGQITLSPEAETLAGERDTSFKKTLDAFQRSTAEGLFTLGAPSLPTADPTLAYWTRFAAQYVSSLCRLDAAFADDLSLLPPPSDDLLASTVLNAPPFTGSEYLNTDVLLALWTDLSAWTNDALAASQLTLADWLKKSAPKWRQVGRVCFHLAENKTDAAYPFAFMATYAPSIAQSGRVQFLPLGNALKEYAGAGNKPKLVQLLKPIHQASRQIPFVSKLLETGEIYHPLAWTPQDAYALLRSIPELEENGLLTRLPNRWKKRTRAQVNVTVGEKSKSLVGLNALMSFRVQVAMGDKALSQSEIDALLAGPDGLINLNGQWIEVDKDKLQQALAHWENVQQHAASGDITFAQGMRLLAGAPRNLAANESDPNELRKWSRLQTSPWLSDTLAQLRDPKKLAQQKKHPKLQATLRPYQQNGFDWLKLLTQLQLGAILADDMGLGKTIQIIALLLKTAEQTPSQPSLLILPASLLANWKSEFAKFAPSLKLRFLHPSENDKASLEAIAADPKAQLAPFDVVLTTYGMLLRQQWILDTPWNLVVLDEAQAIKNPNTRQTRAVKKLQSQSRIALTGTPIENRLTDLWSLFDFACPGLLGNAASFQAFTQALKNDERGYAPLRKLVSPYILRRLKTDKSVISDLPDKTEINAYCQLAPRQAALYQKTVRELIAQLKKVEDLQRSGLVLTTLVRLKQICNHPSQATGDSGYKPADSGKFERLGQLCEEIAARQEKVLVFTQFKEIIDPLAHHLSQIFHRPGLTLHGGTPVAQRKRLVDAFQKEDGPPFFILSLKAGGSGLTLTAASHVIHFDRWWNPAVENQATDRAFRIGQKKNVLVHKFITQGTIEEKVDRLIAEKRALSDDLLKSGSQAKLTDLTDAELLNLVSLDITQQ